MPFYFRKSVRLGGGVRMNFSKSGVGVSFGTKGCRVSTGPRGTYINMGTGGIYYRQKIGGPLAQPSPPTSPVPPSFTYQTGTPIPTAGADQLVDSTSAATLERLNATIHQPAYAPSFVLGGVVLGFLLAVVHPIVTIVTIGFALYLAYLAHGLDRERRMYNIEYTFDEAARVRWVSLGRALHALAQSQAMWRITTLDPTYDWKRNAGANSLLNRVRSSLGQQAALCINANITPYCLNIGGQQLYFFPDRIYVYQNGTYGAVEYDHARIATGETRFIENTPVPSDAQVVGHTWQYVNKNGGPDRRFSNNRQLPIANYGVLEFRSDTGMNVMLHVSSLDAVAQFGAFYQQSRIAATQPTGQHSPGPQPRPRQRQQPVSPPPPIPNCYQVLGLTPNCTKEEAAAKYRQLASSYHPDRVHNLAPEFRELAHRKMTEINNAVTELKRLRGW